MRNGSGFKVRFRAVLLAMQFVYVITGNVSAIAGENTAAKPGSTAQVQPIIETS